MEFIKTLNKTRCGREKGDGSLIISDGELKVRLNDLNVKVEEIGVIDGGIGVVVTKIKNKRANSIMSIRKYGKDDIPVNLQGEKYRFSIPAEKISDTEYVFMFDKAKMLNKK